MQGCVAGCSQLSKQECLYARGFSPPREEEEIKHRCLYLRLHLQNHLPKYPMAGNVELGTIEVRYVSGIILYVFHSQ